MISLRRAVRDGVLVGTAFAAVTLTSLVIRPLAWIADYPPDVRAAVAPSAAPATAFKTVVAGSLVLVLLAGCTLSIRALGRARPDLGAWGVASHIFVIAWVVNAIDVVVVDWIFFMHLLRRWVVLPGTEGLAGYDDYFFHFEVSVLRPGPWIGSLVASALAAFAWWSLAGWRRARTAAESSGPAPGSPV